MPKLKYKKGDYKHFIAIEALSGHQVRIRSGGTTYGIPLTTSTTVVPATWNDASETDPGVDRFRTHISLKTPAGVRHLRAEANHTNVGHSDIPHTDSTSHNNIAHANWTDHSDIPYVDWSDAHGDTAHSDQQHTNWNDSHYDRSDSNYFTKSLHSDWGNLPHCDVALYSDYMDYNPPNGSFFHVNWNDVPAGGLSTHEDAAYQSYPLGIHYTQKVTPPTYYNDTAHSDHTDHSDTGHGDSYPHNNVAYSDWTNHSNIAHGDAAHTNWYDSVKEAI